MRPILRRGFCAFVFILSLASVLYYLWGPLYVSEFQADVTDTVLWAEVTAQSGSLCDADFFYAYVIPFGGNVLFAPFVRAFGTSLLTLRLGMTCFLLLLTGAYLLLFKTTLRTWPSAFLSTGGMLALLACNKKLREIMYAHIIHYSLAILFSALMLICLFGILRSKKRPLGWIAAAAVTCFFCAADGLAVIVLSLAPVLGAALLEALLSKYPLKEARADARRDIAVFAVLCAFSAIGLAFYFLCARGMHTAYADSSMGFMPVSSWFGNFKNFCYDWIHGLFRPDLYADTTPIAPAASTLTWILRCAHAAVMVMLPLFVLIAGVLRFRGLAREQRVLVLTCFALTCVTILLYTVTRLTNRNWRKIPMLAMLLITAAVLIRDLWQCPHPGFARSLCALLVLLTLNAGFGVLFAQAEPGIWLCDGSAYSALRALGYDRAYTNAFLLAPTARVVTDGQLHLSLIRVDEDAPRGSLYQCGLRDWQSMDRENGPFACLYLFEKDEELTLPDALQGYRAIHTGTTYVPGYIRKNDGLRTYMILEYDAWPFGDTLRELHTGNLYTYDK